MSRAVGPARGVLRAAQVDGEFHHARFASSPALESLVQHYWSVRWDLGDGPPVPRETLPHPNVHLVVEHGRSRIWGVHSGRFSTTLRGRGEVFGIKFRVGGFRRLLGEPVARLRDRSLPLQDIFGSRADKFEDDILGVADDAERVAIAESLLEHAPPPDDDALLAAAIVDGIAATPELTRVDAVLARWPMSPRTLQRLFSEYVGVGPKWVINRYRLHETLARLEPGAPVDWTQFALTLGYYDQAHFIRDFTALVGRSPTEYLR